jgi:hypothetical protein
LKSSIFGEVEDLWQEVILKINHSLYFFIKTPNSKNLFIGCPLYRRSQQQQATTSGGGS